MNPPSGKKGSILKAARKIIQDKNFHEMTLDEVAAKSGVAKGTLYLYFKNKEELFISIFKDIITENEKELSVIDGKDDLEYLEKIIKQKLDFLEKYSDFAMKFMAHRYSIAELKRIFEESFRKHLEFMARMFKEKLKNIDLRNNDYFGFAMNMFLVCRMYMIRKDLIGEKSRLSGHSREILVILLNGWRIKKSTE